MALRILIPKGRIHDNVAELIRDAGFPIRLSDRTYRPDLGADWLDAKIMKPQNVGQLLELGSHDAGFTGIDWIKENNSDVELVLDLGFDHVSIVAAIPASTTKERLFNKKNKKIVVATEYVTLAENYLKQNGCDYKILRTYGATEVFPPDDADMIIDNTASGRTLHDNGLVVIDTLLQSSTWFAASKEALRNAEKREQIERLAMLFKAALDGRERVMLEMNVSESRYKELVGGLPAMRSPTVAPLYNGGGENGYAIKIAVKKSEAPDLIPRLKKAGATDIVEYALRKVVP
ncbi:MAG: ATP phosphoribosyltransferase [Spirochaetaceae bacterium]|jgi:ATP phosphoribosyltransferase|nr:ATP phosphoribosyltransferase [Spirochaetaceae bacterium]